MSISEAERVDTTVYKVLMNQEEQYSLWPDFKQVPLGWTHVGKTGSKSECLAYVKDVWTDMRPLSLRRKMEEFANTPRSSPPPPVPNTAPEKTLVDRLCEGEHPVAVGLRPERTVQLFKAAIDRNYVHIKFTETKGGTELGLRVDREASVLSEADFENGKGTVHIEGNLILDYVRVKCIADIDLITLEGKGHLEKQDIEKQSST